MSKNTGARYEIAVDGKPRSHRDVKATAIEAATYLKTKSPHAEVTVRDVGTGEVTAVKHPLSK
jgi:electron transfer flavoprotein alpha/beta subunit